MEQPAGTLRKIVAGGADAILTTYGMASRFAKEIVSLGLILRLDGGGTKLGVMGPGSQFYAVEDALRLGADAVAVSAFPGSPKEEDTLRTLAGIVSAAHAWGIPVMGEMVPSWARWCLAALTAAQSFVAPRALRLPPELERS
jgi:DhnA family fructose-bisphosphate aldolase class Ia